ncbi:hypothetical protein GcM1_219002 [Golovinomyces cichoracearum]|uniref:ATP synthase subunit J, mitochondrial n=1 Tax=Golovinomyces cichoracearum TaxID=62708 RepID=A0A420IS77_9PEZI|nr:hypothetical protein GcM1_219002 [Golovinomyces cichoracearum]
MSLLGKKFPAPVEKKKYNPDTTLSVKPMAPFMVAGIVVLYGINSLAEAMMKTDEFKNDPRNPNAKKQDKN